MDKRLIFGTGIAVVLLIAAVVSLYLQTRALDETREQVAAGEQTMTAALEAQESEGTAAAVALADALDDAAQAQSDALTQAADDAAQTQSDALTQAAEDAADAQAGTLDAVQAAFEADSAATATESALVLEEAIATAEIQGRNEGLTIASGTSVAAFSTFEAGVTATAEIVETQIAVIEDRALNLEQSIGQMGATATLQLGTEIASVSTLEAVVEGQADEIATLTAPRTFTDAPLADVDVAELFYWETFDESSDWFTGPLRPGAVSIEDGQYVFTFDTSGALISPVSLPIVTDAYMEVDLYLDECPDDGLVGIMMRATIGAEAYNLSVSCDLRVWFISVDYEGFEILGVNAFTRPAVAAGEPRVLGALVDGDELTLYLDGEILGTVTDDRLTFGLIGLFAETNEIADAVIRFDNVRVWNLAGRRPGVAPSLPTIAPTAPGIDS